MWYHLQVQSKHRNSNEEYAERKARIIVLYVQLNLLLSSRKNRELSEA